MESFNKILSFVIGLVVVVVFLAIISGKINIGKKFSSGVPLFGLNKTTPTPTPTTLGQSSQQKKQEFVNTINQYQKTNVKEIPSTGSPTIVLPFVFSSFLSGLYLRNKK